MTKIISIKKYSKQFGSKVVFKNFDLDVEQGEMIALVGSSGSGKTTLLNTIGLIDTLDSGEYLLFGEKAPKSNSKKANEIIRTKISYLFQNFALVDNISVFDNLMMAMKYIKKSKDEKKKMINSALKQVGLSGFENQKVFEISGGEQQRVAIARAILKPSEIVLADEPTGSLDSENRNEILDILCEMNAKGKTIVVVTHDLEVAKRCERMVKLK